MAGSRFRVVAATVVLFVAAFAGMMPAASAQEGGDTLVIAMQKDVGNYNYFDLASNTVWKAKVLENLYDSLSSVDTTGDVFPYLASEWTTISDQPGDANYLKVTVTLRPDLVWSDGKPLTADDVVFTFVALRHPATTYSSFIVDAFDADDDGAASKEEVEAGVKKLDARTIEFTLAKKYGQFYKTTLGVPIVPKHIWEHHLKADADCAVCLDTQASEPGLLVGSSAWKFKEGVKDSRYVIERNDLFWGKEFKTPAGQVLWNPKLKMVEYDIYTSLESAILALRSGKVDHIPWTITAGHIPGLAADPAAKLNFVSDNGYFYLSFNMKREPMNDMTFRQAMSHLIDKKTVVDVYMGGFGQAGDSVQPPFWSEWYNASVKHYDYNKETAKRILREGGYTGAAIDAGSSPVLLMPDGRPVPSVVLLTPPADYDPIRIKTGEFIAKNMRELGIDVVAKAIDFNTLVSRMNGFDYQMLIIGWNLASDPVGNVCDILGPRASQNYFGFWDPTKPELENPTYKSLGGVSTLADADTRALVAKVDSFCKTAKESFDPAVQVKANKDAQGALSEALPVNVLYYRTNAYAVSSEWTGWITFLGELLHPYSLGAVQKGAAPAPTVKADDILVEVNAPAGVPLGADREVQVAVYKANGAPAPGATLSFEVAGMTVQPLASVGTANADGLAVFNVRGKGDGFSTLWVNATLAGKTATTSVPLAGTSGAPPLLFTEGKPAKTFLAPGETISITYTVRDQAGRPVPGAEVVVDETLLAFGSVTPASSTTGPDGKAAIAFRAPTTVPSGKHLEVSVVATSELAGIAPTRANVHSTPLLVKAPAGHDWGVVSVEGSNRWAADAANRATTLNLVYKDEDGAPAANRVLTVEYTKPGELTTKPATVTTGTDGKAALDLVWAAGDATRAVSIRVFDAQRPSSLDAWATLLFKGTDGKTGVLGGHFELSGFVEPDAAKTVTGKLHLYGLDGQHPSGKTNVALIAGATPFGQFANLEAPGLAPHSSVGDAASIQAESALDGRAFATGGSFAGTLGTPTGPYADWAALGEAGYTGVDAAAMKPLEATNGVAEFTLSAADLGLADRKALLTAVPNGVFGFHVTDDEGNFYWKLNGETAIGGEFASFRTEKILGVTWDSEKTVLRPLGDGLLGNVTVTVVDQDNEPVEGAAARVYQNGLFPPSRWAYNVKGADPTGANGLDTLVLNATPGSRVGPHNSFGRHDFFVSASKDGHAALVGGSHLLVAPIGTELTASLGALRLKDPAGERPLTIAGVDENGKPLAGWTVSVDAAKGEVTGLTNGTVKLDDAGKATLTWKAPSPSVVPHLVDTIRVSGTADKHVPAVARAAALVVNPVPAITIGTPTANLVSKLTTLNVTGRAMDDDTIRSVQVKLDGGTYADLPIATGSTAADFAYSLKSILAGTHTLTVRATDGKGFVSEENVVFTVAPDTGGVGPTEGDDGLLGLPAPGLVLALAAVGVAGLVLRRRK